MLNLYIQQHLAYYDQPHGKMYKTKVRNYRKLGVYYCEITIEKQN